MSTPFIAKSRNLKTAASKKKSVTSSATARRKVTSAAANAKVPPKSDEPKVERVTKQERLLTLLSQAEGASIEEMMQATDWQQHSVRGFLAGTVKKKLGFALTTSKAAGDVRRYCIATRRGRYMAKSSIDIAESLARLSAATIFELRGEWRRLHRAPPPMRLSRDLLMRGITYKLQERPRPLQIDHPLDSEAGDAQKPARPISLKAGTRLVREWRGVTYTVLVHAAGFEWNGRQCPVCPPMNPLMQIREVSFKVCFVGRPRQSINLRGGVAFDGEERHPQAVDADVLERSEFLLLPLRGLPYAFQRL
jgi:hypothetical protein